MSIIEMRNLVNHFSSMATYYYSCAMDAWYLDEPDDFSELAERYEKVARWLQKKLNDLEEIESQWLYFEQLENHLLGA